MKINQIDTPALILEKRVFEENCQTMNRLLEGTGMALRPHYKSHKCPAIAQYQLRHGAKGITCAKLSEAEDLARYGVADILIANQVVQPEKLDRLAVLAGQCRLTVCIENEENVLALEAAAAKRGVTLYCLVEYEIGMGRCGVQTHDQVLSLARFISSQPHLVYEGIQAYAGNLAHEPDPTVRSVATRVIEEDLSKLKAYLIDNGLPPKEISGGSTGTVETKPQDSVYTEMQCGSYIFIDRAYRDIGVAFENALFLLTTVISTKPDRIVTDGGVKSLGMDQGEPVFVGYEGYPIVMSEEHGQVAISGHTYRINDKILYIPGHCCTTINVHDQIYLVDGDDVVEVWDVVSRGKSQ